MVSPQDIKTITDALSPAMLSMVASEHAEGVFFQLVASVIASIGVGITLALALLGHRRGGDFFLAATLTVLGFGFFAGLILCLGADEAMFPALNLFQAAISK